MRYRILLQASKDGTSWRGVHEERFSSLVTESKILHWLHSVVFDFARTKPEEVPTAVTSSIWARRRDYRGQQRDRLPDVKISLSVTLTHTNLGITTGKGTSTYEITAADWQKIVAQRPPERNTTSLQHLNILK